MKKSSGEDRFIDEPVTYFLQWQGFGTESDDAFVLASISYTPSTRFDSTSNQLEVESDSLRGALSWRLDKPDWLFGFDVDFEMSERNYQLGNNEATETNPTTRSDFTRDSFSITFRYGVKTIDWHPVIGLRYFSLDEKGFFGVRSGQFGQVKRREPLAFFSGTVKLSPLHRLKPTIYLGHAQIKQSFSDPEWRDRDENEFIGKLSLPWQYVLSAETGAVMTLALSLNLHEASFGGGNMQLHWPL